MTERRADLHRMGDALSTADFGDDELSYLIAFGIERGMQPL